MLAEIFRRMVAFGPLETYCYVGFGSVWFSDFVLFHRTLGVRKMLSIEKSTASRDRFVDNSPFKIDFDFRPSSQALPDVDYSSRQFIWLDYDDPLSLGMLGDAAIVASRAASGTLLAISVQCSRAPEIALAEKELALDENAAGPEERFRQTFGADRVPANLTREDLAGWPFGELSRSMLYAEIEKAVAARKLVQPDTAVTATRIVDFEYEDGAKMTTIVVLFCSDAERHCFAAAAMNGLDFRSTDGSPVYIPTPKLTLKEFRFLERQLPLAQGAELQIGHIPPGEAREFAKMYRYFPNFAIVES